MNHPRQFNIDTLLQSLRSAQALRLVRDTFSHHGLPLGTSWDSAGECLRQNQHLAGEPLQSLLERIRLTGRKSIFLYHHEEPVTLNLSYLHSVAQQSPFASAFPCDVDTRTNTDLGIAPTLTAVQEHGDYTDLVFCSVRESTQREVVPEEWLNEEVVPADTLQGSQWYFVQTQRHQAFDIVRIPKQRGIIEVRVDHFGGYTVSPSVTDALVLLARTMAELGVDVLKQRPINIFPLINIIYDCPSEGRVTNLGFVCPGTQMRSKTLSAREGDLRTNEFHQGGAQAVQNAITVFSLEVTWEGEMGGRERMPQLLFPGTLALAYRRPPALYEAKITRLLTDTAVEFAINRLRSYAAQLT